MIDSILFLAVDSILLLRMEEGVPVQKRVGLYRMSLRAAERKLTAGVVISPLVHSPLGGNVEPGHFCPLVVDRPVRHGGCAILIVRGLGVDVPRCIVVAQLRALPCSS